MRQRNLLFSILLLLLAGGSWWLAELAIQEERKLRPKPHTPDYFVENFTNTQMDLMGKPLRHLQADQMNHYPDDDSTELVQPHMTTYDKTHPPWHIRSETGWLSGDGEMLLLQGSVKIDRSASDSVRPIHITTSNLRVQPNHNYAETDEWVTALSAESRLKATGMQVWLAKPVRIKLLANVRGRHEVN